MDKEKETENQNPYEGIDENIVKLTKVIEFCADYSNDFCKADSEYNEACKDCKLQPLCERRGSESVNLALHLIDEGYGNVAQAVKEFLKKVEEICDSYHLETKEIVMMVIRKAREELYPDGTV